MIVISPAKCNVDFLRTRVHRAAAVGVPTRDDDDAAARRIQMCSLRALKSPALRVFSFRYVLQVCARTGMEIVRTRDVFFTVGITYSSRTRAIRRPHPSSIAETIRKYDRMYFVLTDKVCT